VIHVEERIETRKPFISVLTYSRDIEQIARMSNLRTASKYGAFSYLTKTSGWFILLKIEKVKAGNETSRSPARLREPGKV